MIRLLPIILSIAITVYAVVSVATNSDEQLPGGLSKGVWIAIVILAAPLGGIAWLTLLFIRKHSDGSSVNFTNPFRKNTAKNATKAPDDDDEFLFKLERDLQLKSEGIVRNEPAPVDNFYAETSDIDKNKQGDNKGDQTENKDAQAKDKDQDQNKTQSDEPEKSDS